MPLPGTLAAQHLSYSDAEDGDCRLAVGSLRQLDGSARNSGFFILCFLVSLYLSLRRLLGMRRSLRMCFTALSRLAPLLRE